jgi:ABC-type glutathione transport system ATPase component
MKMDANLLSVQRLAVEYKKPGFRRRPHRVIHDVSFTLERGETVALVGESGSGKSTIGKAILGLTPCAGGSVKFRGQEISDLGRQERRRLAGDMQVVFQNPYGSLNPALTIGQILSEPLTASGKFTRATAATRIAELLERVNMPSDTVSRFPGNFSGGQRQRVAIARALALDPSLIICDEPTSALDVSTQSSVLELLAEIQNRTQVAYLFITHDLAVVREFADRAIVLEQGTIVEEGPSRQLCDAPQHEYTRKLIAAAPVPDPRLQRERRERRLQAKFSAAAGVAP